jgi:hypothetical protein
VSSAAARGKIAGSVRDEGVHGADVLTDGDHDRLGFFSRIGIKRVEWRSSTV